MSVTLRDLVRIGLALIMVVSGIAHFVAPRPYVQHLPDAVPFRGELVAITGLMELMLVVGLVGPPRFRRPTGWPWPRSWCSSFRPTSTRR